MTTGDRGGPERPHGDEQTDTRREEETDVHTLTGAYALDALDDVERARVERHLAECPSCSAEVRSFAETTALLASGATAVPPPGLRDRVMAEVARTRQLPPLPAAPAGSGSGTPGRSARTARWLAVAATSLLVLSLGLGVVAWDAYQDADRAREAAAGMQEIVTDPSREMLDAEFTDGGKATIVVAGDRMVLLGEDVPAPPEGHGLQLWMIGDDGPRPSVMLEPTGDGGYWAQAEGVRPGDAFGVTVEEAGGAQTPSDQLVLTAGA